MSAIEDVSGSDATFLTATQIDHLNGSIDRIEAEVADMIDFITQLGQTKGAWSNHD